MYRYKSSVSDQSVPVRTHTINSHGDFCIESGALTQHLVGTRWGRFISDAANFNHTNARLMELRKHNNKRDGWSSDHEVRDRRRDAYGAYSTPVIYISCLRQVWLLKGQNSEKKCCCTCVFWAQSTWQTRLPSATQTNRQQWNASFLRCI